MGPGRLFPDGAIPTGPRRLQREARWAGAESNCPHRDFGRAFSWLRCSWPLPDAGFGPSPARGSARGGWERCEGRSPGRSMSKARSGQRETPGRVRSRCVSLLLSWRFRIEIPEGSSARPRITAGKLCSLCSECKLSRRPQSPVALCAGILKSAVSPGPEFPLRERWLRGIKFRRARFRGQRWAKLG